MYSYDRRATEFPSERFVEKLESASTRLEQASRYAKGKEDSSLLAVSVAHISWSCNELATAVRYLGLDPRPLITARDNLDALSNQLEGT